MVSTSARSSQISQGSASTTITSSEYSGSNDIRVRRPRAVASAKPATSSNSPIAAEVVSSSRPASIDQANQALRRFWPMICHECSSSSAHSGRASTSGSEFDAGRTERHDRHRQQHRQHRLLAADDGARQIVEGPEGGDGAELRQQIDAEHVIADGAVGDIGQPERQRRAEPGSDLVFPAERQHGREIAGRAAIDQHRQQQPERLPAAAPPARPPAAAGRGSVRQPGR